MPCSDATPPAQGPQDQLWALGLWPTYLGLSDASKIDARTMKHFRAYHNAGAMVNIHISRLHKDGGRLEQRIMEQYRKKKERTWQARGLTNVRRSARTEASQVTHTSSFEFVESGSQTPRRPPRFDKHRFDNTHHATSHCPRTRVWLTYLYLAKRERFSSARENDSDVAVPAARPQGRGWGE